MTDFSKFRSSLGGFNRADVANYIETLCAEHQKQIKAEQTEREDILDQLNDVRSMLDEKSAAYKALEEELAQTKAALEETQNMLEEALSMEPDEPQEDYHSMELEAYRRAEAMERATAERAAKVNRQLGDLVEETAGRYEQVGQDIKSLSEDLGLNLQRLQEALSDLDAVFEEATDRFDTIDTEDIPEEE